MYARQAILLSAWKIIESDFATHWNCHSFLCGSQILPPVKDPEDGTLL
jgi:hypothetical protein